MAARCVSLSLPFVETSLCAARLGKQVYASELSASSNAFRTTIKCIPAIGGSQSKHIKYSIRSMATTGGSIPKTDEEWRAVLSPEQFRILRKKGTEYPGTSKLNKEYSDGVYECAGCGTPLYKSTTKFNSGCGWPAFYEGIPGAIATNVDADGSRIEITCAACGGHLGHVFKGEGFKTPTDERHCVNGISLTFKPADKS